MKARIRSIVERDLAHAGHDPHVEDDVEGVGELDAHLGERRTRRPHQVRDHVHRPSLHGASGEAFEAPVHGAGLAPIVGGAGFLLGRGTDVGQLFDTGDVVGIGAMVVAAGMLLRVETEEDALVDGLLVEAFGFLIGTVAPDDTVGLAEADLFLNPGQDIEIGGVRRHGRISFAVRRSEGARLGHP